MINIGGVDVIKSFADRGTEDVFDGDVNTKQARKFPRDILRRAVLLLDVINNTSDLNALRVPPGNRLKELEPPRKDTCSVRINDQWRITFKFNDGDFFDVKIEDYH